MQLRAMLWKEIRENASWTALALVALSLAAGRALAQMHSNCTNYDSFDTWLIYGAPLFGIALGLLQILPEKRRDQWAFLVSRPASRDTLFWSKVLAGTLLYFVGTLPVWLGACAWIATPGHVAAPFDWHEALPGIADILVGHCFYAAALLVALRPARWYGSRVLPFFVAGIAVIASMTSPEFVYPALFLPIFSLILLAAACGSFRGTYRAQPKLARAAAGVTLLLGWFGVMSAVSLGISSLLTSPVPDPQRKYVSYEMLANGLIIRETHVGANLLEAEDLQGHSIPLPLLPDSDNTFSAYLSNFDIQPAFTSYRQPGRFALFVTNAFPGAVRWYYLPAEHRFFAYSNRTRRHTETLGQDAIRFVGEPEPMPFKSAPMTERILQGQWGDERVDIPFPNAVFRANFARRTVSPVLTLTAPERVLDIASMYNARNHFYVGTSKAIDGIDGNGHLVSQTPYPSPPRQSMGVQIHGLKGTSDLSIWFQDWNSDQEILSIIERVSANGTVLTRTSLPMRDILSGLPPRPPDPLFSAAHLGATFLPIPVSAMVGHELAHEAGKDHQSPRQHRENERELASQQIAFWFSVFGTVLSALAACLIGRRCVFNKRDTGIWALLCLVFGFSATVVMLSLRAFPTRKPCPHCKKQRSVERDLCEHCGKGWPAPSQDGTEVFDVTDKSDRPAVLEPA